MDDVTKNILKLIGSIENKIYILQSNLENIKTELEEVKKTLENIIKEAFVNGNLENHRKSHTPFKWFW